MRISDWSSDVCSSDLAHPALRETADGGAVRFLRPYGARRSRPRHSRQRGCAAASAYRPVDGHLSVRWRNHASRQCRIGTADPARRGQLDDRRARHHPFGAVRTRAARGRSEEHTSELQSLMRISYAVFCLKKKTTQKSTATSTTATHTH